jgi:ubiquinone/menaquinone biosynthesis C-methylase UbiE
MDEGFDPVKFTVDSEKTWSEAAPRYDKLSAGLFGPMTEAFVAFADVRKGMKVLDVACGPGLASRAAARKVGEKGSVLAVDLAPGMIELAAGRGDARIDWRVMDAQKLDLPDASFDAVLCQLGLMLFARPDAALAGMRRAAKPGAPVACLVQGRRSHMLFTGLIMEAMVKRAPELKAPPGAPTLFAFGPDGPLSEAFARAGLTEIVTRRLSGAFRFASAELYWEEMTTGAGRTGAMLRSLPKKTQERVRADVVRAAERHKRGGAVLIPYEFLMARGIAPR